MLDLIAMCVGYVVLGLAAFGGLFVLLVFIKTCAQEIPAAISCNATLGVPKRPVIAGVLWALKGGPSAVRVEGRIWDRQAYMDRDL